MPGSGFLRPVRIADKCSGRGHEILIPLLQLPLGLLRCADDVGGDDGDLHHALDLPGQMLPPAWFKRGGLQPVVIGIVAGGGVTLVNLSKDLKDSDTGASIVKQALKAPFIQIMENAGLNAQALLNKVEEAKDGQGVNIMKPEQGIVDLKKEGVIDPARVTREAVQNAVSIAATAITMGSLIVEVPEKEPSMPAGGGMGGMY